ncbi:beta-1,3-glucan-binding protein-like isoform X7 [Eriocheir sinensis]|uniref:beta-1,3-glucan-binding protein-like isoform X1 n=1 Tax=Eriocheir sinensis TaxID=95602 RepID=UPI0021C666A9|nr:beta-1,3-glucan-binding protein-like isoform X1 [Eriocheir sinensis]XP_050690919.1 beta-1,3-glucan-binding protein-like isoform X6 [Eriocheir sinensis]XP_050690920.1 beta-1,3-glucan-binding protein-like isoform X7 [Eriocheir sinensis]
MDLGGRYINRHRRLHLQYNELRCTDKMKMLWLLTLAAGALAADVLDPSECTAFPCLIFNDEFDFLDHNIWEHEITMGGGGNFEFQTYLNNRSVSYARDSTLFIKPQLMSDWKDEEFLSSGELDLWGMNGQGDVCTSNLFDGCKRTGNSVDILPPVFSARLRSLENFAFKYGRIEVRAKMPRGDWLWPAVWLLPENWPYGPWPASGEIDILESRGNDEFGDLSNLAAGSTLHWGPFWPLNFYEMTASVYNTDGSFADAFHVWRVDWTSNDIKVYLDDVLQMTVDPGTSFWDFAGMDSNIYDNPWAAGEKMAPYDQKFYIVMNLAVGGTGGFFPDGIVANKPWENTSPQALLDFWSARDSWLPTWKQGEGKISEGAAMQVDYVKVWKMESVDQ